MDFVIFVIVGDIDMHTTDVWGDSCGVLDVFVIKLAGFPHHVGPVGVSTVAYIVADVVNPCSTT